MAYEKRRLRLSGKGLDGYVHYRQGMQEAARNAPNASGGRRPVSAEQKTTEPAPKSDESGQISSGSCSIRCIPRA